jgi:uncharacterized lipoprotein YddW (UPF0748 family)
MAAAPESLGRAVALTLLATLGVSVQLGADDRHDTVRALWVVRTTLTTPAAIDAMVGAARAGGFDTLLVQVRGRGDAYYSGGGEPRPASLSGQPASFDPLAVTIARAHAHGLRVHAWINVSLVASAADPPTAETHVIRRHPEWLMVSRGIAAEIAGLDSDDRAYLERLARDVRTRSDLEGLYLSPLPTAAADYTAAVVRHIVERYPVDGVHLDDVRYPSDDFDYSRAGLAAFRNSVVKDLPLSEQRTYDARYAREPFVYADTFPERWRSFRQMQLTRLVVKIRDVVKAARPSALLSAAVVPDATDAARHRLQDWPGWLARGLLDAVCPMAYTTDGALFAAQISAARTIAGARSIWAGIGAYRLSQREIVANVRSARQMDVGGVILFSYDGLASTPGGPGYVAQIGRAAFER